MSVRTINLLIIQILDKGSVRMTASKVISGNGCQMLDTIFYRN